MKPKQKSLKAILLFLLSISLESQFDHVSIAVLLSLESKSIMSCTRGFYIYTQSLIEHAEKNS